MRIPAIRGVIDRRILVNFRIDPDAMRRSLPDPFRPKLVGGRAIGGICLIRLKHIRPALLPLPVGLSSENGAHRIAVEWDDAGCTREGVYIPRRDTNSRLNYAAGGRLFPGVHHLARFTVRENDDHYFVEMIGDEHSRVSATGPLDSRLRGNDADGFRGNDADALTGQRQDGEEHSCVLTDDRLDCRLRGNDDDHTRVRVDGHTHVRVDGRVTTDWPAGSVFASLDEASAFFEAGALGYSATRTPGTFDGLELACDSWHCDALAVDDVYSSWFQDESRFPRGTVEFDCALLMRGIHHEWHSRDALCCSST